MTQIPFDAVEHADRAIHEMEIDLRNAVKTCEGYAEAIRISARIDAMIRLLSAVEWDAIRRAHDLLNEIKVA